uniref:Ig-like domain-containing protein n=1 Tax=Pundamilia nyererei TaxID=303518 RepID=A0A3B4HCQ4_9CICH
MMVNCRLDLHDMHINVCGFKRMIDITGHNFLPEVQFLCHYDRRPPRVSPPLASPFPYPPAGLHHLLMLLNLWKLLSLLQKTPSSPVSCHATGFYPDRAMMFWSKDGEELHEGVDHREILPNNDETFQLSVDLNVSSVTPEDWRRYDCVFQLSDDEHNLTITKLNKAAIRSNWGKNKKNNNEGERNTLLILFSDTVNCL